MGIVIAILLFSFIIFFHEFGHFVLAKANGIDVDEFSIGMGPCLLSHTYHGTQYSLRLLPIGGFCSMGEDEEAGDSPSSFNNKSVWARMSVIAAGPVFNFLLAFVLAVILVFMAGADKPVVAAVSEGYPAEEAGIEAGDTIVKMGNKKINVFREITTYNQFHQGETTAITYQHNGEKKTVTVTPKYDAGTDYYYFGISGGGYYRDLSFFERFQYAAYEVKYWICTTVESLGQLITGRLGLDQLSGPVGIVSVVDESYNESREYGAFAVALQMIYLAILLSADLGVMNLLPIPALDGGRLFFLIIEAIRGKRIPPEREGFVHFIGMVLLLILMVVVFFNDIRRIFF